MAIRKTPPPLAHMRMHFNKKRISLAYQIIGGIPEKAINLDAWVTKMTKKPGCNTIACGFGWLAMHPEFRELGLHLKKFTYYDGDQFQPVLEDQPSGKYLCEFEAASKIFGDDTYVLFTMPYHTGWDGYLTEHHLDRAAVVPRNLTDKDLLLARLQYAYYHHSD